MEPNKIIHTILLMFFVASSLISCGGGDSEPDNNPTNSKPVISGSPDTSVISGSLYSFTPTASDPDKDAISFSIENKPTWASFNTSSGNLSGTPTGTDAGITENITITVSDGKETSSLPGFNIDVTNENNNGGEFNFNNASYSVNEGEAAVITITRSNTEGTATVTYVTQQATATYNVDYQGTAQTQLTFENGVSSKSVTIQTLDDQTFENTESFNVVLSSPSTGYTLASNATEIFIYDNDQQNTNTPPTISGTPNTTIQENTLYSFTPSANDADSDALTFGITNAPTWSTFNSTTGTLSGTPTTSDIGTTNNIIISVSDGTDSTSLNSFNITVTSAQPSTGSVSLSWTTPTLKENGEALDNLAGFKIYYGTSSGIYDKEILINDAASTSININDLNVNTTYYFALTSFNTESDESKKSDEISKLITAN